jgi:hypothetical protein
MPVLIAIVLLSFVTGLLVRQTAVVYTFTGMLALLANVTFLWAIADGKGDDPGWIVLLSLAAGAAAFAAARGAIAIRRRFLHAGVAPAAR